LIHSWSFKRRSIALFFGNRSVVIHDRAVSTRNNKNRFTSVSSAQAARPDAQFWIHPCKLMEGIGDPSFVAVAIHDLMGNVRQFFQQIGRVTRRSRGDGRLRKVGWVLAADTSARHIATLWSR
jgi:hypothetical protein